MTDSRSVQSAHPAQTEIAQKQVLVHKTIGNAQCYHRDNGDGEPECKHSLDAHRYKPRDISDPDIRHLPQCRDCYEAGNRYEGGPSVGIGAMKVVGRARTIRDAIIESVGTDPEVDELPNIGETAQLSGIGHDSVRDTALCHEWLTYLTDQHGISNYIGVSESGVRAYQESGTVHVTESLDGVDVEKLKECLSDEP